MIYKQEVVNVFMNFLTFEKSREELTSATAKLEQMNWSFFRNASIAATVK